MFPWLMLRTRSRERVFGGDPIEPLGTVQARPGVQQAPCTLRGFGEPADLRSRWELTLRLEMSSQSLSAMHLGPRAFPRTLGQVTPAAGRAQGSGAALGRALTRSR